MTCTSSVGGGACSFTLTVVDVQAPQVTCPASMNVFGFGSTAVWYTATASDNCPGVTTFGIPPSGSIFSPGMTVVTDTAVDTSGHAATCTFSVTVASGAITGFVFDDRNRNGIQDPGEPGMANVPFFLDKGADGFIDAMTISDATGHYGFYGLTAATYRVRQMAIVPGITQTTVQQADIVLADGQQVTMADTGDHLFPVRADYDGDRRSDVAVYRPGDGTWYWLKSATNFSAPAIRQWGNQAFGDIPVAGDIDGDRVADQVVWRAATGTWYWLTSSSGYSAAHALQWGNASLGDVPLLGDVDGDGKADLILWRASTGTWFWLTSSSGYDYAQAGRQQWGNQALGDVPLVGDIDGDGKADLVVWRASTGTWFWLTAASGFDPASSGLKQWGNGALGDVPVLGDFDGDGHADLAVWRPGATGVWYWLTSGSGYSYAAAHQQPLGTTGDVPSLADFDSDGLADLVVWHPATGVWSWLTSTSAYTAATHKQWGAPTDIPMVK